MNATPNPRPGDPAMSDIGLRIWVAHTDRVEIMLTEAVTPENTERLKLAMNAFVWALAGGRRRPEVEAFADLMEARLKANDHKPGWKDDAPVPLVMRLHEEAEELENELHRATGLLEPAYRKRVGAEAADVANFAMMIADVSGSLEAG